MKSLIPLLALLASAALCADVNQWTNVGPSGAAVRLTVDPQDSTIIYAANYVGLFKSKDSGATWNNTEMIGTSVSTLVIDPHNTSTLYALTTGHPDEDFYVGHVVKSVDGAATWKETDSGLPSILGPLLAIDPQDTNTLYVFGSAPAVPRRRLFKTTDGGASWVPTSALPGGFFFGALAVDPQNSGTLYAAAENADPGVRYGMFKSTDGGASWNETDSGLPVGGSDAPGGPAIDPKNLSTVYVTMQNNRVYKTTNGGASWVPASSGLPSPNGGCCISDILIDPQYPKTLYAPSSYSGLFKSTDGGANWSMVSTGLGTYLYSLTIDPQNTSTLYESTGTDVYRSTDGGATFTPYSRMRNIPLYSLAIDPQTSGTIYAGSYKSTDAGLTWTLPSSSLDQGVGALAIDPRTPSNIYAGIYHYECGAFDPAGVSKSVDAGHNWTDTNAGFGCVTAVVPDPKNPSTVYAASQYRAGIYKSTDGGTTWSGMSSGLPRDWWGVFVTALAIDPQSTRTLYAASPAFAGIPDFQIPASPGGLFKTTDGGMTWRAAASTLGNIVALAIDPQTTSTVYAATAPNNATGTLWKSADGGATWRNLFPSSPASVFAVAINPQTPSTIYAATETSVLQSKDGGDTWTAIPGAPTRDRLLALDPRDPDTLYAGGPGGLFRINLAAPVGLNQANIRVPGGAAPGPAVPLQLIHAGRGKK